MQANNSDYIISGGQQGKARLNVLSEVLQEYTRSLLEKNGVSAGMSFLDAGCGGGNVAEMVAQMVRQKGSVTAIDFDEQIITLAAKDAVDNGVSNLSFQTMSAYDIAYDGEFDVAYARFLLSHLKDPLNVLMRMKQSVKTGGRIIIEDVQFSGHFCYPASMAFNKYVYCYSLAAKHNGADANIGPSLVSLFNRAGIVQVGFDVIQPAFSKGAGKWMAYHTLAKIKDTLVANGMLTMQTAEKLLKKLEDFTLDESTIMSLPRIFRVWGVRE